MHKFTTKQPSLFIYSPYIEEQTQKIDTFLRILEESGVSEILTNHFNQTNFGRPGLDPATMLATIILGFAFGASSLRELADACKYDLRFLYIVDQNPPNFSTFSKFINGVIKPNSDEIFACITKAYFKHCKISFDICHIDGTKFQARPNKYKFVWKPTTWHEKLTGKIRSLLNDLNLSSHIPKEGYIPSQLLAEKLNELMLRPLPEDLSEQKIIKEKILSLSNYLSKNIEYEEKEEICGPNRNSYYKTDHDATGMCLKEDYYSGLGTNLHPAYQMQTIVSNGFIVSYYVSQDRSDLHTFIPAMTKFHAMYDRYPKCVTADSGYGDLQNYQFCENNGIEAYIKYQQWAGEANGRRPALFELNDNQSITCINGNVGYALIDIKRHHKIKGSIFYKVSCPLDCAFMPYCRQYHKEEICDERIFEINTTYQKLKQLARDRLLTPKGIEMRINRSCQVEGVYGILKYDMAYSRIRRVNIDRVNAEYMLTCLGFTTRKLFNYIGGGVSFKSWKAPENLISEQFRKPSAKRLATRARKRRAKQQGQN